MPRNTSTAIGNNKTGTHLSTNIVILVEGNVVGAVQTLSVNEARKSIRTVDEVGTDGHIDSAPDGSTNITGSCTRVRFDRMRIAEAFSRPWTHVHAQRIPFDIEIHDRFHDQDENNAIITVIQNVWFDSISYNYSATEFVIQDQMNFTAEGIYSVLNNNNVVGATNAIGQQVNVNAFEQQADRGQFRGALDANGLLTALANDP